MMFRREGKPFALTPRMVDAGLAVAYGVWLGVFVSPWSVATYVGCIVLLWWVRKRPRFVDAGRFCAGAWRPLRDEGHLLALGFTRYGERGPFNGLQLTVGTFAFAVFAILPRAEWAEHKRVLAGGKGKAL
ncbi:hypothetical protein [Streptomyces rubiginosohelvolus]|uniref:hypothetical protein n=1 Tax=Streptomyces rubiginosohelvolus TaxID=67362 RepID=UPI0035D9CF9C